MDQKVLRVIRCALDIQKYLGSMSKHRIEGLTLRVKLGIGVGNVDVLVVGGVRGRFENLPAGDAFHEAFNSENDCLPQQVIISQKAYELVKDKVGDFEKVGDIHNYWVKSLKSRVRKVKYAPLSMVNLDWRQNKELFEKFSTYIPRAVVPHLRMPEQAWVGELREVTIMFSGYILCRKFVSLYLRGVYF